MSVSGRDCEARDPPRSRHVKILTHKIALAQKRQLEWKMLELDARRELGVKYGVYLT